MDEKDQVISFLFGQIAGYKRQLEELQKNVAELHKKLAPPPEGPVSVSTTAN
jgi:hypothetical protein